MSDPVRTITRALAEAQAALAAYLEPGGRGPAETISRLLAVPALNRPVGLHPVSDPVRTIMVAVTEAQAALAAYLKPDGPNSDQTIARLLAVLDHADLVQAMRAIERRPV